MTGYTTQGWGELFLAEAGASAALAGLLFVAVSINLQRIISIRSLPGAALTTIVLLVAVLMVSTFALVPDQPVGCAAARCWWWGSSPGRR
jgi:hypothetical protein